MKQAKYRELTKLFHNLRKEQFLLFVICTASVSMTLYFAYQVQGAVDLLVSGASVRELWETFFKMLVIGGTSLILGIIQTRQWHLFRYKTMNQMRMMMHERLLNKEAIFFDGKTTGDVVSAIMADGSLIAECAGTNVLMLFLNVLQVAIIISVLVWKNYILGMIEILAGAIYFLSISCINKKMRQNYMTFSKETANLNQRIVEDTKAVFEIKTLNEKKFFNQKFCNQITDKYFPAAKRVIHLDVLSYSVNEFISIMFPVFILVVGGAFTYQGLLSIGSVILFYTYTQKLVEPLNNLSDFYRGVQMAVGAADRVYEYLFTEEETKAPRMEKQIKTTQKQPVSLKIDIDEFGYEGKNSMIQNIHETFESGDKVFIYGESGAGKSTLLKLICGFYNLEKGTIQVNGINIENMPEEQLFEQIKIQLQEPVMLEGSLRQNVELGQKYEEKEIWQVLQMVNMEEFASENGLDYQLTENGKNLSGGQKQRLALARVLLRKPSILILDEATSALDWKNEETLVRNINQYIEENGGILLITSHRNKLKEICNKTLYLKNTCPEEVKGNICCPL